MPGATFLCGLLALLQVGFLPGYLLARAARLRAGVAELVVVAVGLSALANYLLLTLLVTLGWYTRGVMFGVVGVEVLLWAAVWWWRDAEGEGAWARSSEQYRGAVAAWGGMRTVERGVVAALLGVAVFAAVSVGHGAIENWQDQGFNYWDNVFSWNRWMLDWAADIAPRRTFHYPQLLTSNASVTYVMTGHTDVQSFARLFFALFPVGILVLLIDLGVRLRRVGYWVAVPLIYLAWVFVAPPGPADGYADVPVTFMILLSIHLMLTAGEEAGARGAVVRLLLAGAVAGAATVTKQTGFYLLAVFPALAWLVPGWGGNGGGGGGALSAVGRRRRQAAAVAGAWLLAIAIGVPWYVHKQWQIRHGIDISETALVAVDAHQGRGMLARMRHGFSLAFQTWGAVQTVAVCVLALGATVVDRGWRWVVVLLLVPGSVIYLLTTSYDLRNAAFIVGLGCTAAGVTAGAGLAAAGRAVRHWRPLAVRAAVAALVAGLVVAVSFAPSVANESVRDRSLAVQRTAAMPKLNEALYRMDQLGKFRHPFLTNYWIITFLPGMKGKGQYNAFTDPVGLEQAIERTKAEYMVIVWPDQDYAALRPQALQQNLARGTWSVYERGSGYLILKTHAKPLPPEQRTLPKFGDYRVIGGLEGEEGPYPEMKLPLLRWGDGPESILEFDGVEGVVSRLVFEVKYVPVPDVTVEVKLNGVVIGRADLTSMKFPMQFEFELHPAQGANRLELVYSNWDKKSARPLGVMYTTLQVLPK